MDFLWNCIVLVNLLHGLQGDSSTYEETITYYENLIETETFKAFHYDVPTSAEAYRPKYSTIEDFGETFDFIVVGSGSAGAVVANRLSEVCKWKVLLLEAGGTETDFTDIPGVHMYLQGLEYNWNYNTTTQKGSCLGMIDHRCSVPRGRVMGGSSTINGLVYCRGNKLDYDGWATAGNKGWSYKEVLPYFIKSENSQIDGNPGYHGKGGYWNVEPHRPISKQLDMFIEANRELLNYSAVDYNGERQLGMSYSQLNNIHGRRDSTAKAFLRPVTNRPNLKILTYSYVTKVLIDMKTKTAYGVQFTSQGKYYAVRASKEVIISGGTINSPQILMLSGIGPQKQLKKLGIPLVANLPVGETLRDHPTFFGLYVQTDLVESVQTLRENVKQYLNDYGLLSIALNSQGVGFYQTDKPEQPDYPDFEYEFMPSNSTSPFLQRSLKATDETYEALWSKVDGQRSFNVYIVVLHPKSKGNLRLLSSDPFVYPLVNINSLTDPEGKDIAVMYQGLLLLKKLLQTEAMRKINAKIIYGDYPQCREYVQDSKDYWYCCFRILSAHLYHPISTCRMGPDPKNGAVVDYKLKVHGINGLRVADASIIPFPTSGHTSAPAVMIEFGTFDFVVIGAGSAGAVVASRLSEVKKWNVLLIEAGCNETTFSDIPAMYAYLQGSDMNWGFKTVPQTNSCLGMVDNSCLYPRGKVMGGSTVLNTIVYCRGNQLDYDGWAAEGNPGWSYEEVLPFFKKSEHSTINGDPGYHGENGTFNVEYHTYHSEQVNAFYEANKELNIPGPVDYNGKQQLGYAQTQFSSLHGRRVSSSRAFLDSITNGTNLKISKDSYAVKILINRKREVEGLLFAKKGHLYRVRVRQEIIVSAGAIQSPQLLMLSGIGPKDELKKHGIPVVQDLAVGENFQEHATFYGLYFATNYTQFAHSMRGYLKQYFDGVGALTMPGNIQNLGFYQVNTNDSSAKIPGYPDYELLVWAANDSNSYLQRSFGYTNETYDAIFSTMDIQSTFLIEIILLHPKSKGRITLKSSNPYHYPVIDSRMLTDPQDHDIDTIYAAVQFVLNLAKTKAFQRLNTTLFYAPLPQCKQHEYLSKDYWYCIIGHLTWNLFHPIGTCKMGPDPKKGAVVDHTLKVHGIAKLRVADASIIPFATSGHTSAPSIMIGERVSSFIKKEKL